MILETIKPDLRNALIKCFLALDFNVGPEYVDLMNNTGLDDRGREILDTELLAVAARWDALCVNGQVGMVDPASWFEPNEN
jgi:hypothetical protein